MANSYIIFTGYSNILLKNTVKIVIWLNPYALLVGRKLYVSYKVICFTIRD